MKNKVLNTVFLLSVTALCSAQPAGSLDLSFGSAGKTSTDFGPNHAFAHAIALQPDGKMVVAGEYYSGNNLLEDFALARYLPNGTLDPSFGTNGKVSVDFQQHTDVAKAVAIQPDGKIVVAGYSDNGNNYDFAVMRFLSSGALDNSFGNNGKVVKNFGSTDFGHALALLPNGKILVAGRSYNGANSDFAFVQLNANGSFDNSFGSNGALRSDLFGEDESANALAVQPDGKIVAVGDRYANNTSIFAVARYLADGSPDPSFGVDGKQSLAIGVLSDVAYAVAMQSDSKIVIAGQSNTTTVSDFAVARFLSDGTPDPAFGTNGHLTTNVSNGGDYANAVVVLPNGKILAGGFAAGSNSIADFALVRYQTNGNLDPTFGMGGIGLADFDMGRDVCDAMVLSQGKAVMAGYTDKNAHTSFAVARFEEGSLVEIQDLSKEASNMLRISPNPANERIRIGAESGFSGELRIFSCTGNLMAQLSVPPEGLELGIADWPTGVYFVQGVNQAAGPERSSAWTTFLKN